MVQLGLRILEHSQTRASRKQQFWTTWQSFVAIPAILHIGWMLLAPEDLRLSGEHVFLVWLAIFALGAVAGLIRLTPRPAR
ncbi:hypothetical protein ACHABQ_00700 [Nesterenkonia aurantiaca]|uniref:hypothetical protein n=1 Tax=Nesterenkonia aurantiaca TaxID=1436010 RepID=UPI003EE46DF2